MGTNYYLSPNRCVHCGRGDAKKHIGKSSAGWAFSLHVYPEDGVRTLDDWIPLIKNPANKIEDEYGREITVEDMFDTICNRKNPDRNWDKKPGGYASWSEFHERNYSEQGPEGLVRFRIDNRYCIGHGEGTWDLIVGEFS